MVITIEESTTFKSTKARSRAILDVLWAQPEHRVISKTGRATEALMRMLPIEVVTGRGSKKIMSLGGFSGHLKMMEDNGWIIRDMVGKRTKAIMVVDTPSDWQPSLFPTPTDDGIISVEQVKEADPIIDYDDEAREGDIRPGRLAARLEKIEENIPALVEEGVVAGIQGFFTSLAVTMGFRPETGPDESTDDLIRRLTSASQMIDELNQELTFERAMAAQSREELNKVMRLQTSTRDTTSLRPTDVGEAWKSLAHHAINSGWTISRTKGGHLQWRAPDGYRYFSSSTSSDYRSVRNARSDMEKAGLPKEDK